MPARHLGIVKNYLNLGPKVGPKSLRISLDFIEALALEFDATADQISAVFGTPQAIYINNTANNGALTATPAGSGMAVFCPSFCAAMLPINTTGKLRIGFLHTVANAHVDAWLFNTPQPYYVAALT